MFRMTSARHRRSERPFDLAVYLGEVLAVTGPLGWGKSALACSIFGPWPLEAGNMTLDNRPWRPRDPAAAIAAGVFYAGEDRWRTSFFPAQLPFASVAGTISFPFLRALAPAGFVNRRQEARMAAQAIDRSGIKAAGPHAGLAALSGGNQQKVVLARWSSRPARLLLLDEPFQGVDVGAREDIIRAIPGTNRLTGPRSSSSTTPRRRSRLRTVSLSSRTTRSPRWQSNFVGVLLYGLTVLNAPYYLQDFVKGAVLIGALALTFGLARHQSQTVRCLVAPPGSGPQFREVEVRWPGSCSFGGLKGWFRRDRNARAGT